MGMMTRRNVKARLNKYDNVPTPEPVETISDDKAIVDYSAMPYFTLAAEARKRGIEVKGKKKVELCEELKALGV